MTEPKRQISARLYDAKANDHEVEIEAGMKLPGRDQLLWIDVDRDEAQLAKVAQALGISDRLQQLAEARLQARLVQAKEFVRISVIGLENKADKPNPVALDLVALTNVVITVHDRDIEGLGEPLEVVRGETQFGELDESAFVAMMLDALLTGYFRAVDGIERRIDEYDTRALLASVDDDLIGDLVGLRRQIGVIRRALSPQREVFYALERPGLVLGDSESAGWPQIADRFRQAVESVENARELLVGTFDIVISRQGERTNDVMRALTVLSSVLLPAVVIAGLMGMNFKAPIFDDPNNFYVVLIATALLAVVILLFARFKHWI